MNLKHKDLEIPADNPFLNCKLKREKYSEVLTKIIEISDSGFVLAINNEWGTGKTTFIRMWRQSLINSGFRTIYLNAWESDFDKNPLIAILAELKPLMPKGKDVVFNSLLKKGTVLTQKMLPSIIKAIAEKHIDTKMLVEAIENLSNATTEILKDEVEAYTKKKKGLIDFRVQLGKYIESINAEKQLIFIIDELDRCRPDYAVEVLEHIKHFFCVPGIVFILSVDKLQLGNAIRGFYGCEQINASEYLRRFIDIEYTLPNPESGIYCKYLYDYFQFDEFFNSTEGAQYKPLSYEKMQFLEFASILFQIGNTTLRQQENIFAYARMILLSFAPNSYIFSSLYIFLIYIRNFNCKLYECIRDKKLNPQELVNEFEKIFERNHPDSALRKILYVEVQLIKFYFNSYSMIYQDSVLFNVDNTTGNRNLNIHLGFNGTVENSSILQMFTSLESWDYRDIKIDFLINKIDLLKGFAV